MSTATHAPLEMLCASHFPAQPVQWLWPGKIPVGKVTLLIGDPGTGKSLIALDVAARVSRAMLWPDHDAATVGRAIVDNETTQQDTRIARQGDTRPIDRSSLLAPRPSSVLLLSAQDDLADTIRPRLDANGADPDRIFCIPSIADLRHDFGQLRDALDRAPDCRLVILDPVNAYVGPADTHFQTVVRRILAPLARIATQQRIAVLAVAHLRKTEGAAIYRAAGSMGYVTAARAVWTVCRDDAQPGRHLLLPVKNNLAPAASGLAYKIEAHESSIAPVITWDPTPIPLTAEQYRPAKPEPPRPAPERAAAREFLRQALAAGPRPAREIICDGQQRGFLRRTLQRAFYEMRGHTAKPGLSQGWWWSLNGPPNLYQNENAPKTRDIFEDVTEDVTEPVSYEQDVANSIAILEQLERSRADAYLSPETGEKTGSPLLDSLLDALRNPTPKTSAAARRQTNPC